MTRRLVAAVVLIAAVLTSAGCGIPVPRDPDGTLDAVRGGELRAGVSPNGRFVQVDEDAEPSGEEAELVRGFARLLDADVDWTVGSEEALVRGLENGDLDLVAGGFTDETPWTDKAGMTRPYAEAELDDGSTAKLVMLVPLGENAFLSELERYLDREVSR